MIQATTYLEKVCSRVLYPEWWSCCNGVGSTSIRPRSSNGNLTWYTVACGELFHSLRWNVDGRTCLLGTDVWWRTSSLSLWRDPSWGAKCKTALLLDLRFIIPKMENIAVLDMRL